jgi:hypothetical protein
MIRHLLQFLLCVNLPGRTSSPNRRAIGEFLEQIKVTPNHVAPPENERNLAACGSFV